MNTLAWTWVIVSLFAQGGMPVFQQRLMQNADDVKNAALHGLVSSSFVASGLLAVFVLIIGFSPPKDWDAISWHLAGMTILYAAAHLCIFQSMRFINPSLFAAIFTARVIVIVSAAVLLLNEAFSPLKAVGIAVIIGGILVSVYARNRTPKTTTTQSTPPAKPWQGVLLALLGTLCFGAANVIDAEVVKTFSPPSYLLFRLILPVLLVVAAGRLFMKLDFQQTRRFITRQRLKPLIGMSACLTVSSATFMLAYLESRQLAYISGIHQLSLFATVGFSAVVNPQERKHFGLYAIAACVCFGGVVLLRWG